jgi:Domain of unknown function (DUF4826)
MVESNADADIKALESWYKSLLDQVVKEMVRLKAVQGAAVQAAPVWMIPHEVLIAKVWGVNHENDFVWTASVDKLIADYIGGSLAATPREVAKHFSLKWQMDADRILNVEKSKLAVENPDSKMWDFSNRLIQHAESLYEMANRDDVWQERQSLGD